MAHGSKARRSQKTKVCPVKQEKILLEENIDLLHEKNKQAAAKIEALRRFIKDKSNALWIEIASLKNSFEEAYEKNATIRNLEFMRLDFTASLAAEKKEMKQQLEHAIAELKKENMNMKSSFEKKVGDIHFRIDESVKKDWSFEHRIGEMNQLHIYRETTIVELNKEIESLKLSLNSREAKAEEVKREIESLKLSLNSREAKAEEVKREMESLKLSLKSREAKVEKMNRRWRV